MVPVGCNVVPIGAFFRTEQVFEDVADNVMLKLAEIETRSACFTNERHRSTAWSVTNGTRSMIVAVENGLVVTRDNFSLVEHAAKMVAQPFGCVNV